MRCTAVYVDKSSDGTILFLKDGDGDMSMTNDAEGVQQVICTTCGMRGPYNTTVKDAVDGWNELRRAVDRFAQTGQSLG